MKNNDRVMTLTGDPSSKYGLHPERFEEDIHRNHEKYESLYGEFVQFMKDHHADPRTFREMWIRYYKEFIE